MDLPSTSSQRQLWLFSKPIDLAAFLGSALLALVALFIGHRLNLLDGTSTHSPEWAWVTAVLLIDVAHVWSTGFRVYFVPHELRRRPMLYALVPLLAFLTGVLVYATWGTQTFWRVLAYVAVFHFVRQQYGWVALYRGRVGERHPLGKLIDTLTIYLAMLYPLVWWHAHLPRQFWWFLQGDFHALPQVIAQVLQPIYWLTILAYLCRSTWLWVVGLGNPGKDIVVITTAMCWHVGIITFNSDYAFLMTNVIIHGVPYVVLVWWTRSHQLDAGKEQRRSPGWLLFQMLMVIWVLAYFEELLWDRIDNQKRSWLFGEGWNVGRADLILIPLLAVPQLTHYVLDGFIWRRRSNPDVARAFASKSEK